MVRGLSTALLGAAAFMSGAYSQVVAFTANNNNLGTPQAATYPMYIKDSPDQNSPPWGGMTTTNANPYTSAPNTNQTRKYTFNMTRSSLNIGGVSRPVILVNGQFPGPTIEANYGDWVELTVNNNIDTEGTSIHMHGLLQKGTQSQDGVPGIDHCPIAPGSQHVYKFQADLYGSSWWHSHYSAQYAAGVSGPVIIHGPTQVNYTADKGPIMITDWSFSPYEDLVEEAVGAGQSGLVRSNITLINGKTNPNFTFHSGESYRLRLVNHAAEASFVYSIDEHQFTVIAHDFVPVTPYVAKNVSLQVGQRVDIVVNATGDPTKSYYMRAQAQDCTLISGKNFTLGAIYYEKADTTKLPTSIPVKPSSACGFPDDSLGIPLYPLTPPTTPGETIQLNITIRNNKTDGTGSTLWYINNSSFRVNYDEPVLQLASQGNTSYPSTWNVYQHPNATSVRIVTYNSVGAQHPMHLHGHNFWIIAQGTGIWDGKPNNPNPSNPVRRDVHVLPGGSIAKPSYIVIEYNQDNPGAWPYHCHIAWHVSAGLYTTQLELQPKIQPQPASLQQTCTDWMAWQNRGNIVDQIDSGERKFRFARH